MIISTSERAFRRAGLIPAITFDRASVYNPTRKMHVFCICGERENSPWRDYSGFNTRARLNIGPSNFRARDAPAAAAASAVAAVAAITAALGYPDIKNRLPRAYAPFAFVHAPTAREWQYLV